MTMNSFKQIASAMVVEHDKIIAVGKSHEFNLSGDYQKIDLHGKTVLPGFNDSHLHLLGLGEINEMVDLSEVNSRNQLVKKIELYIEEKEVKAGEWIIGRGWNQNKFKEIHLPDRNLLDKICPANPVFLKRVCGHIGVANSLALEIAKISDKTPDPIGGKIDRDINGQATGILREKAMTYLESFLPEPGLKDYQRILKNGLDLLSKAGVTSIQTDDFGSLNSFKKIYSVYNSLREARELPLRINLQLRLEKLKEFKKFISEYPMATGYGDDFLEIGPCKILADGSMGARTAALFEPYSDQVQNCGLMLYDEIELREYVMLAYQQGFQLAIHGIGDKTISKIIEIYAELIHLEAEQKGINIKTAAANLRPRIIHCQITNNQLLKSLAKWGIAVDVQPIFLNSDLHIAEARLGRERLKGAYAWKTMLNQGIRLAGSSDAPVESYNPFAGIYAAVTRKDLQDFPSNGWLKDEKLSVEEAIKIFTYGSAYNSFKEKIKGSIEQGKLADFIIVDQNPIKVDPNKLKDIKVLATYVGGKEVFSNLT